MDDGNLGGRYAERDGTLQKTIYSDTMGRTVPRQSWPDSGPARCVLGSDGQRIVRLFEITVNGSVDLLPKVLPFTTRKNKKQHERTRKNMSYRVE
jgi:hypothetical protein